jgi:hypothetical protein
MIQVRHPEKVREILLLAGTFSIFTIVSCNFTKKSVYQEAQSVRSNLNPNEPDNVKIQQHLKATN